MKLRFALPFFVVLLGAAGLPLLAAAQGAASAPPADPWPRIVDLGNGQVLVDPPQIDSWTGNALDFRAALGLKPSGSRDERVGVVFATARTQGDNVARTVVFENMTISKIDFPTLPGRSAAYATQLQAELVQRVRSSSLDRMEAALAAAGVKAPFVGVDNTPPQVIVSYSPAILVPIDGAPVLRDASDSRAPR